MIKDEKKNFAYASDFYTPCFTENHIKLNSAFSFSNWIQYFTVENVDFKF